MKRPQITPGPWILDPDERRDGFWIDSDTTEPEEIANACTSYVDSAQALANARAIAALPALLEALEDAYDTLKAIHFQAYDGCHESEENIKNALRLAGYEF